MSKTNFETIITGQFTEEERIRIAISNMQAFLSGSEHFGGSLETTFVNLYQDLLEACGFDETMATQIIRDFAGAKSE